MIRQFRKQATGPIGATMNKALSWNTGDIDFDMRAAARQAARLEGLSVSEWLSSIIAAHAAAKDVDVADLGAEERALAVNERLRDVMGSPYHGVAVPEPMTRPEPVTGGGPGSPDAPDPVGELKARLVSSLRATASGMPSGDRALTAGGDGMAVAEPKAAEPASADAVTANDVDELARVEAKLNALFRALDRAPGAPDRSAPAAPSARIEEPRPTPPTKRQRSLEEFPEPFRQAVEAIAKRQAILDGDTQADAAPAADPSPAGGPEPSAPGIAATGPVPSSPLADISGAGEAPAPADAAQPDAALGDLGHRIDVLAAKIDNAVTQDPTSSAIDRLSNRIEQVQQTLVARVSVPQGDAPAALAPLETMIQSLIGKVDTVGQCSLDLQAIGPMLGSLASKLDEAQRPQAGSEVWDDLRQQIGALAGRIDRSDAGLTGIVAIEQSLGDLFSQMEETREAAINAVEGAARTAARDTLRALMAEQGAAAGLPTGPLSQELAQFRTMRDVSDQRLHAMLGTLNQTLEKVVVRLIALEPDGRPSGGMSDRPIAESASAKAVAARPGKRSQPVAEPGMAFFKTSRARRSAPDAVADDLLDDLPDADFPLEPGGPSPSRTVEPRIAQGPDASEAPAIKTDPQHYIAAARRAAQAAAERPGPPRGAASATSAAQNSSSGIGKLFGRIQRRPLLLSLAGLILLIGALQVARLSRVDAGPEAAPDVAAVAAPATTQADAAGANRNAAPVATANADAPARSTPPVQGGDAAPASGDKDALTPASPPAKTLPTLALGAGSGMALGRPASADPAAALAPLPARLRDMANAGNAAAQYEIGLRFAEGRGVARDPKAGVAWFEKAARQDLAPAAYRLGSLYEKGLGVAKDLTTSMTWYSKAADLGNVRAMHNLAVISAEGAGGKSDYAKAATWFAKASQMGVRDSQFNLAILYARGLGIEQNLTQSYTWFAIAAAQGDEDASKKRDEVAARLDAKALADAKEAAQAFHATPSDPAANEVTPPAGGWDAAGPTSTRAPGPNGSQAGTDNPRISRM